jgi:hypothetical protein
VVECGAPTILFGVSWLELPTLRPLFSFLRFRSRLATMSAGRAILIPAGSFWFASFDHYLPLKLVASHGDFTSTTQCETVYSRDDWFWQLFDLIQCALSCLGKFESSLRILLL